MATRKIGTDLTLTGEKAFNDGMKSVNSNLKVLKSDMAACTAEFADNADGIQALTARQKILTETVDQQKEKVAALQAKYKQVCDTYGETSAQADKYKVQLNQATVALHKDTQALEKNGNALKKASKEASKYIPITQRMGNATKNAKGRVKDLGESISDTAHHTPVLGEALDVAKVSAKGLGIAAKGATKAVMGLGKATAGMAKGVGAGAKLTAKATVGAAKGYALMAKAAASALAAAGTMGTVVLGKMIGFARESAEAAKAAKESWKPLTEQQKEWYAFSQQLDSLDEAAAKAKSALGGVLLPQLQELSSQGAEFLNSFAADMEAAGTNTEAQTEVMTNYIIKGAQMIKDKLPEYVELGKDLVLGLGSGFAEIAPELVDIAEDLLGDMKDTLVEKGPEIVKKSVSAISAKLPAYTKAGTEIAVSLGSGLMDSAPELLDTLGEVMGDLLDEIIANAPAMAEGGIQLIDKLIEGLTANGPQLLGSAMDMVVQIVEGLAQAAPDLIPAAAKLVTQLVIALVEHAPDLLLAGLELVLGIISGITEGLGDIFNSAGEIITTLKDAFVEKAAEFLAIGKDIVKGIWDGISAGKDWIYGKIEGWVGDVLQWIKDKFGIASPSKLMRDEVGIFMAKGIGVGFEQEMRKVNQQIVGSINTSFQVPELRPGNRRVGRSYNMAGGKTVNLYFYAQKITEADIHMIVERIDRELGDAM